MTQYNISLSKLISGQKINNCKCWGWGKFRFLQVLRRIIIYTFFNSLQKRSWSERDTVNTQKKHFKLRWNFQFVITTQDLSSFWPIPIGTRSFKTIVIKKQTQFGTLCVPVSAYLLLILQNLQLTQVTSVRICTKSHRLQLNKQIAYRLFACFENCYRDCCTKCGTMTRVNSKGWFEW